MKLSFRFLFLALFFPLAALAQAPSGYYSDAKGKTGKALKTSLFGIVADHVQRSYDNLWTDFKSTDMRPDGKVWDMYSVKRSFTFGTDQAGNYKTEGDVYNREHSFPKSWFDEGKPMYTDLFHLYPTDGYVNGRRSNYPFGETNSPTWSSYNGWSKLGPSSVAGYSGTVFEPNDEYKGDFARTYFYMATAYEDKIAGWSSPMLDGKSYPAYATWALNMLLRWAKEDPVSQKEIDRNNAVYKIQRNRNPFIDFPGLEQYVWGTVSVTFNPDNYQNPFEEVTQLPDVPTFYPEPGAVAQGTVVTITASDNASLMYSVNNGEYVSTATSAEVIINAPTTIKAYSVSENGVTSDEATATYTLLPSSGEGGEGGSEIVGSNVYTLITSTSDLTAGANYLIVCETKDRALAEQGNNIRNYCDVTLANHTYTGETSVNGCPYVLQLGKTSMGYTFYDAVNATYLALNSNDNKLHAGTDASTKNCNWTITFDSSGNAKICSVSYDNRTIQYNPSSPRFATYKSNQTAVQLYKQAPPTAIQDILSTSAQAGIIYTLDGKSVGTVANLKALPKGIYVVNGKKVLVK